MPTLLHVDSSPAGERSISRAPTAEFVKTWKSANPSGTIVTRDLTATALKPVDSGWVGAAFTPVAARSDDQKAALALSEMLVQELLSADEYVFGVPMYNFSVPGSFKLWIDQIVRAGMTFAYVDGRPQGLIQGKKATFLIATGADYSAGSPFAAYNFVEPYLRAVFGFLGVTDVAFVTAGGTSALQTGGDRNQFLAPRLAEVDALFATA